MRNKKMYLNLEAKSFALKCHISDMISIYNNSNNIYVVLSMD